MVKVAVAGGTGNVASEIIKGILAHGHSVTVLSRKHVTNPQSDRNYITVDYADKSALVEALRDFDAVLSFLVVHLDVGCVAQKNLIHACVEAGVRRFAPSEWGVKNGSGVVEYENKDSIAKYLEEINREETILEYSLFQPSIFLDYFAHPHPLSPSLITWPFFVDYENRRAMVLDSGDQPIVLTAISDDAVIVAKALDYSGTWPAIGGIRGVRTTINELLALGKKIRGGEWKIEYVKGEDVLKGELKTSWIPRIDHPVIPMESREAYSKKFVIMFFEGIMRGSWDVTDEWNKIFPKYNFRGLEEYLTEAWEGKS